MSHCIATYDHLLHACCLETTQNTITVIEITSAMKKYIALFLLLSLTLPGKARATWYKENIATGSDIIMMDLRWPWWPSGTYYANWNIRFLPQPNNISFYGGFLGYVPDGPGSTPNPDEQLQSSFRPGSVWSFWGSDSSGTPVRFTDVAPNLYIKNDYGGEGCSGTMGSEVWPFMTRKTWYTMLGRVWRPVDGGNYSYVGRWIKNHADGRWHLIGIARLPIPATSFADNSGFIETLSGAKVVRPLHRRFGYCRKDGQWLKADTVTISKTRYVVVNVIPEGDHEYAAIEYSNAPDLLPWHLEGDPLTGNEVHSFTAKQPDRPTLDRPAVKNVRAISTGKQVAVSWEIPDTASPAFSHKIEIFDNPRCDGEPLVVKEERMPTVRHALVDVAVKSPTIRLTLTDIFDQEAPSIMVDAIESPVPPVKMNHPLTIPGLAYEMHVKDTKRRINYFNPPLQKPNEEHYWLFLEELSEGKLLRSGLARGFDLGVCENRSAGYALVFDGLLRVPETCEHRSDRAALIGGIVPW